MFYTNQQFEFHINLLRCFSKSLKSRLHDFNRGDTRYQFQEHQNARPASRICSLFTFVIAFVIYLFILYKRIFIYWRSLKGRLGVGVSRMYNELERVFQCENFEPGRKETYRSRTLIHPPEKLSFQNWVTRISSYRKQVLYNILDGGIMA